MKKYMTPELNEVLVSAGDVLTSSLESVLNPNEFENDSQWWKDAFGA